jgi:hypothetical protein
MMWKDNAIIVLRYAAMLVTQSSGGQLPNEKCGHNDRLRKLDLCFATMTPRQIAEDGK